MAQYIMKIKHRKNHRRAQKHHDNPVEINTIEPKKYNNKRDNNKTALTRHKTTKQPPRYQAKTKDIIYQNM